MLVAKCLESVLTGIYESKQSFHMWIQAACNAALHFFYSWSFRDKARLLRNRAVQVMLLQVIKTSHCLVFSPAAHPQVPFSDTIHSGLCYLLHDKHLF